jgi:hypothetical protein
MALIPVPPCRPVLLRKIFFKEGAIVLGVTRQYVIFPTKIPSMLNTGDDLRIESIISQFILNPKKNQSRTGHPNGETGNIDDGKSFSLPEISNSSFEIVPEHQALIVFFILGSMVKWLDGWVLYIVGRGVQLLHRAIPFTVGSLVWDPNHSHSANS